MYIILSFIIILLVIVIIICYIKYKKLYSKNILLLNRLLKYENLIDNYRVCIHENRNQLLIIRNMNDNKLIKKYIDHLINNEKDNKEIEKIIENVPSIHLRAVLYSKLNTMLNNNIKYNLNIGRKVSIKVFLNIDDKTIFDLCNIINVLLDNSIEYVMNIDKKEIFIDIDYDDRLVISISNYINGSLDLNEISKIGFSSKGSNRGYGLSLVKEITIRNKKISNEAEIINNIFSQIVYLDL